MPNINQPKGLVPSRYQNANPYNGGFNIYLIPSTDGNQFNVGDVVKVAVGMDANGIPNVTKITNGTDTARGVVVGYLPPGLNNPSLVGVNLDLTLQNIPATKTKDYYVAICDDPDVLYEIQDDGLTAFSATWANKNASYTVTNPTSPGQNSATVLATASIATTAGLSLKIIGMVQKPTNQQAINALWLVKLNQHDLNGNYAGV